MVLFLKNKRKRIWISWEKQRRSIELAASLDCELYMLEYTGSLRYLKCLVETLNIVRRAKPSILFVQNPSMILACFSTCFLKFFFRIPVIVDRHSNFFLTRNDRITFSEAIFHFLSYLSIRLADLTIVTNEELSHVVRILGGAPFVLTDKIPDFDVHKIVSCNLNQKDFSVFFITSFAKDEPLEEVLEASRRLEGKDIVFYISGNFSKLDSSIVDNIPSSVKLTGFLSDEDFINMLFSVDAVLVLTMVEYTLLCGCYEAVSAQKPLITTGTKVLKKVFPDAVFVENTAESIVDGIVKISKSIDSYTVKTRGMKGKIIKDWDNAKFELDKLVSEVENI